MTKQIEDFDTVMDAFDRYVIGNEDGVRDALVEAGVLVSIHSTRPPHPWNAEGAERLRAIHSPKETAP